VKKVITLIVAIGYLAVSPNSFALAQSGSLDLTFGTGGVVSTAIGLASGGLSSALQSDGKIIVAGSSYSTSVEFGLVRYNDNGTLDASFGSSGKVNIDFGSGTDAGNSVAIQSDGKIVMAGQSDNGTDIDFALSRCNTDGTLDNTFGTNGKLTTNFGSSNDIANSVVIQTDGKIIAAGYTNSGVYDDFAIVRYNSNGTLDAGFGVAGIVTTDNLGFNDRAFSVVLQSDGKIVVGGFSGSSDFFLTRYNTDGTLDSSFGTGGKVSTDFGNGDNGNSLAIQSDGKIILAGVVYDGSHNTFGIARYNSDGSLDNTFGSGGKTTTDFGNYCEGRSVAIQTDDKIIVGGFAHDANSQPNFALARYNSDGSLDLSFGTGGKVTTLIGPANCTGNSVLIQSDGKILLSGDAISSLGDPVFAIARYDVASVGIAENKENIVFLLNPNPATTILFIQSSEKIKSIKCLNYMGQYVELILTSNSIDISTLSEGAYFLNITAENGIFEPKKFLKQ